MKTLYLVVLVFAFLSTPAWAQSDDEWDWSIAPYLWAVSIDGQLRIGDLEQDIDTSFSDILGDFDFGGSVFAHIGKGHHAVYLDYTWLRLKPDPTEFPSPPFPPDSTLSTRMTINIVEPAYHYRFEGKDGWALVLGARYMDIEMRMTPDLTAPAPIDPQPVETGPDWWDWFVGIKTNTRISTNWDFSFYGTIGDGESDLPWTVQGMFARRFSNGNRLGLGARVWGIDYSENEGVMDEFTVIDATFFGLMVGYEFN